MTHTTESRHAVDQLCGELHANLRGLAKATLAREWPGHGFEPTALVNETYLRLAEQRQISISRRSQFLGLASWCMRRVLIDQGRGRKAHKRPRYAVEIDETMRTTDAEVERAFPVREALGRLAMRHPRRATLVELRYVDGLTVDAIARQVSLSPATVKREIRSGRTFLRAQLSS